MKNNIITKLIYEGPALTDGELSAHDLANVLIGMQDLITRSNFIFNNKSKTVNVKVRAFEKGSFGIEFSIIQVAANDALNFLSTPQVGGIVNLMGLLGISGGGLINLVISKIRNKKVKRIKKYKDYVEIILENDEIHKIDSELQLLYTDNTVKESLEKIVEPLFNPGIERLNFISNGNLSNSIGHDEAFFFKNKYNEEIINEDISTELVHLDNISFNGGKWRVSNRNESFFVSMCDPKYIEMINSKDVVFAKDDELIVVLKKILKNAHGVLKTEYEILKVLEHKNSAEQMTFK